MKDLLHTHLHSYILRDHGTYLHSKDFQNQNVQLVYCPDNANDNNHAKYDKCVSVKTVNCYFFSYHSVTKSCV